MKKLYLLLLSASLLFSSCGQYPGFYDKEIKDYVKYTLSVLEFLEYDYSCNEFKNIPFLGKMLTPLAMAYDGNIKELGEHFSCQAKEWGSFEAALQKEASDKDNKFYEEAQQIYKHYNEKMVSLSKFEELTKWNEKVKIWTFTEIRSGLGFVFTYDFDTKEYSIDTNEESLNAYITRKFL